MERFERGEILYADLDPVVGSEQGGKRPVLVIQNNVLNKTSTTFLVAPLTKESNNKPKLNTHVLINKKEFLECDSIVLLEQIRVIHYDRIIKYLATISKYEQAKVDNGIKNAFGLMKKEK